MLNILCSKNNPFLPLCEDLVFSMANFFFSTVLSVLYLCLLSFTKAAPQAALITHLPSFNGTLPSKHYSGYVTLDAKNLFYYFVVSERKPSEDPVVLWLNGGPGCSSFDGFVYEHGPFNFEAGKTPGSLPKLHLNPSSWSKVSNILYLDSPAGVGLSYSDNEHDYTTGDNKTASDTHTFLLKWFEQYPEFLSNPFFISGESYAGVYVPTLAAEVVKGYIIGNGVTDEVFDGNALVPFAHGMGLISDDLYQETNIACHGNYWDSSQSVSCEEKLEKVDAGISGLNIYDILEPCYHSSEARKIETSRLRFPSSFQQLGETDKPLAVRKRIFGRAWPYRAPVREGFVPSWPQLMRSSGIPCVDDEVANAWLNNNAVRKALHARQNLTWDLCTGQINYYSDAGSMINFHKNLTARGYRALIFSAYQSDTDKDLAVILPTRKTICQVYLINRTILFVITDSGDHDMCVPYTGSEAWTRSLGYKIVDEWRPWFLKNEVAGFTQGYDHNLTFLTVKGSGHTVPEYKPREALAFYSRWLAGEKI